MGDWTDLLPRADPGTIPNAIADLNQSQAQTGQINAQTQLIGQQVQVAQAKAAQDQQYQTDVATFLQKPSPADYQALAAKYPDKAKALADGYAATDEAKRTSDLGWFGNVYSALDKSVDDKGVVNKDNLGVAVSQLQARRDADFAAGKDTSVDDEWIQAAKKGDIASINYLKGALLPQIAAAGGIDKFAQNYGAVGDNDYTLGNRRYDGASNRVIAEAPYAPKTGKYIDPDTGEEVTYEYTPGQGGGDSNVAAPTGNLVGRMLPITLKSEGGGSLTNPATSPKGAKGPMQVMPTTGRDPGYGIKASDGTNADDARVGREYLGKMLDTYKDPAKAWAAYNAGPGRLDAAMDKAKADGKPAAWLSYMPTETRKYVTKNMSLLNQGNGAAPVPSTDGLPQGARVLSRGASKGSTGAGGTDAVLDDDTTNMMADQYLAGDPSVLTNLGRGKQGAANVVKLRQTIAKRAQEQGMSGRDIAATMIQFKGDAAAARTVGTRSANADLAVTEAQNLIPLALSASAALPRSSFLPFSRAEALYRNNTNDPTYRQFVASNNALVNVYARAISPTGQPHQGDKQHAREVLDTAYDDASYKAAVGQLDKEMQAAKASPNTVRNDLYGNVGTRPGSGAAGSSSTNPVPINSRQQLQSLPSGTWIRTPDGRTGRKK